jgi:hypothetical protein
MKIAICTPYYADVAAEYARSLAKMLLHTAQARITFNGEPTTPEIEVFMRRSTVLPRCRNALAKDAADWGANYLLWIDGDHAFPEYSLLRLLSLNLPIVGVNYPRRAEPTWPTAVSLEGKFVWTTEELARNAEVVQVRHLGLGFCLIDMNVIHALRAPGEDGRPTPLFSLEMVGDGLQVVAEDVFFFRRAAEAGFGAYVDHGLSWHVGHLHNRLLTNADAAAQREAFEERHS